MALYRIQVTQDLCIHCLNTDHAHEFSFGLSQTSITRRRLAWTLQQKLSSSEIVYCPFEQGYVLLLESRNEWHCTTCPVYNFESARQMRDVPAPGVCYKKTCSTMRPRSTWIKKELQLHERSSLYHVALWVTQLLVLFVESNGPIVAFSTK